MDAAKEKIGMDKEQVTQEKPSTDEKTAEMPDVETLLKILLDVNQEQNRQTVSLLMNYMNDMEENFFAVLDELDSVKEQLANMQNTPQTKEVRHVLTDLSDQMKEQVGALQEKIRVMRVAINEKAAQLVENFKEHGASALNHVCEFLGIKDVMTELHDSLRETAENMDKSMRKIDTVSQELRETASHMKNVGRALAGKELRETPEPKQKGFFQGLKAPYKGMRDFCTKQADKLEVAIQKLLDLEQRADKSKGRQEKEEAIEKPSIMGKLKTLKEEQEAPKKVVPITDKMKKQEAAL